MVVDRVVWMVSVGMFGGGGGGGGGGSGRDGDGGCGGGCGCGGSEASGMVMAEMETVGEKAVEGIGAGPS